MSLANPHLDAFAKTWEDSFFRPSQNTSFLIPKYQRKYSWKDVQVEEFWQDLNTSDNLFIGTVMLRKTTSGQFEIIDGQQRFLNITMICALIRDKLFGIGTADSKEQARTIQTDAIARRVMAPTGTTEHYFLEPGQSLRTLFKNHIQSFEGQSLLEVEISAIGSTKEERLIKEQYQSLNDKIDETIANDMGQEAKQDKLFNLWMKICQLRIIYVEIEKLQLRIFICIKDIEEESGNAGIME